MKTAFSLSLALIALAPAHAQMFRPETGDRRSPREHANPGSHGRNDRGGDRGRTTVHVGIGHGHGYGHGHGGHRYHSPYRGTGFFGYYRPYAYVPTYGYYSGYGYGYPYYDTTGYYGSGSAAASGLFLGALAGGIIGHNSGEFRHNGWRGAAWGAGAGWLLGSIADANRRAVVYNRAPVVVQPAATVQMQAQPAPQAQPQQVTIINNYYNASPMSGANGLFGR